MYRHRSLLLFFLLSFLSCAAFSEKDPLAVAKVTDPNASFFDVSARRAELASATNPRVLIALRDKAGCIDAEQSAPPNGRMVIPHHYLVGSNGPINPAEAPATEPYRKLQNAVSRGAGRYLVTGESAEAVCVANLLTNWAQANALLDYSAKESSQAWYQVEWTLGSISLAWSVVQTDKAIPAAQRAAILAWMHKVTTYMFDQNPNDDPARENNHAYWRALSAASVGILTADNALYRRGLQQYARALAQLNPDGSLPLEMARHENALHYQSFALAPLSMIAQLASRQGLDLFSLRLNGHSFADGVGFLVNASMRPEMMKAYAAEPQSYNLLTDKNPPAWLELWVRNHPAKVWDDLIAKPLFDSNLSGNLTLFIAPAKLVSAE